MDRDDVVLLSAVRTPIGRRGGTLRAFPAPQLVAHAIRSALTRAGITPEDINEVYLGHVIGAGVGQAPARQALLLAGLPDRVSAVTINEVCGSGLRSVMLAAQAIRTGDARVIVAGGMESMSQAPWIARQESAAATEWALYKDGLNCAASGQSMGRIAEALARREGISRAEQDAWALRSHQRALAARTAGHTSAEYCDAPPPRQYPDWPPHDEGPRADATHETLAALKPVFADDGTVTAGNASMLSDGAAAVVVAARSWALERGLKPLARITSTGTAGMAPTDLFLAPVVALNQAIERAGFSPRDVDLIEINEAFAVQTLACLRRLDIDRERVNIHGGAIALGHPLGASGARVLVTLLHALHSRDKHLGAATLCLGGGNAVAMIIERQS